MPVGGDIIEVTYNHPTIGTGTFYPKAGEDSTYDLGGIRNDDDDTAVDGAGRSLNKKTRKRWSFEVVVAWDMNATKGDLEVAQEIAADAVEADWTFTNINGVIYSGKGTVVGDIQGNGNASTFTLKVSGGGKLQKIV